MQKKWLIIPVILMVVMALNVGGCAATTNQAAATPADFFAKAKIELICPFAAGGGTDYIGRVFASFFMSDIAPGSSMVVRNITEGGGIAGMNYVYKAKPDGTVLGVNHQSEMTAPQIFKKSGVEYDLGKMGWIGFMGESKYGLAISSQLPIKNLEQLKAYKGLKLATLGPDGDITYYDAMLIHLLGLQDAKIVAGYQGPQEIGLAIQRKEVDAFAIQGEVILDLEKKGIVIPSFLTLATERDAYYPNAPTIVEIVKPMPPEGEMMLRVVSVFGGGKGFFTPPNFPADKLQYLRESFNKMMKIDGFLKSAKLKFPIWSTPRTGEQEEAVIKNVLSITDTDIGGFTTIVKKYLK